jgi:hypothetical protein
LGQIIQAALTVGKIFKLRSDMLFLTMVEAKRRVIVLTELRLLRLTSRSSVIKLLQHITDVPTRMRLA